MIAAKGAFPVFVVEDLTAAETFYTRYLDFAVAFSNDWYLHLVNGAGVQIGFLLPRQPTQPPIFHLPYAGAGAIFSLEVDDADAAFAEARAAALPIVLELRSEDWGQRHFCIQDPNGLHLDIVQSIEPSAEYRDGYSAGPAD